MNHIRKITSLLRQMWRIDALFVKKKRKINKVSFRHNLNAAYQFTPTPAVCDGNPFPCSIGDYRWIIIWWGLLLTAQSHILWRQLYLTLSALSQEFVLTWTFPRFRTWPFCATCQFIIPSLTSNCRLISLFITNILLRATSLRVPNFGGVRTLVEGLRTWSTTISPASHKLTN